MSTKRITKEFAEVSQSPPEGFTVALPPNESIHTWQITLVPPPTSPFHPGKYGILLTLPVEYPFKPPTVRFTTRLYHPNVTNDSLGNICLGILKPENWKPSTKIAAVLDAVRNLLVEPQPDDPLEERIADEYRNDRASWEKNVRIHVEKYALTEPAFPPAAK
ncbi:ubiquitin-conjugating enzyme [Pochonia chlamydosporia 170]|uniref:E2 ubiquitin-conjugating enzyme n=1 Tax=Pochonia chlamydosporia 170 TaxID=1380566 RepID=A0A179EZG6_METCM|nr:ubiquitin-conjugating enzyme [Pochonia chlamydosporia 170]OAQ58585.1 ubiquitin-conjugating enzyme [Pochonia chlamydosporia 170]